MSEVKKKNIFKRILYYFRVDFTTIQGRLTGGFLSMAVISFILIQGANYQWSRMVENRNIIIQQIAPTRFYASEVTDKVDAGIVALEKAFLFNDESFLDEYDALMDKLKADLNALKSYTEKSGNNTLIVLFSKVDNQIGNLKREINQLRNIYAKRKQIVGIDNITQKLQKTLQSDIASIVNDIKKTTIDIINLQDNLQQDYDAAYKELEGYRPWIISIEFFVAVALAATIGSLLILDILRRIRRMRDALKTLAKGDIPAKLEEAGDELNTMVRSTNDLIVNLQEIETFALDVGNGRFDSEILVFEGTGSLGTSLMDMKNSLKAVYEQEQLRAWATAGLAKFSDILRRNNDNIEVLCTEIISECVKYLKINQGGIFVLNKNDKEPFLELKGAYAYNKQKSLQKKIKLGEGLLGQAFLEGGIVHIKQIPQDYMMITSGLGNLQPKSLLIVPLQYNEEVIGVVELASFDDFLPHQIDFLKSIAEVTASTIMSAFSNDATRVLLLDMQSKTESIKEQEEMLRLNAESLVVGQEELSKNLDIAEKELFKMKQILDNILSPIVVYDEKGIIKFVNRQTESIFSYDYGELNDTSIRTLLEMSPDEIRTDFAANRTRRGESTTTKELKQIRAFSKNGIQSIVEMQTKVFETGKERLLVATLQITNS
ncbi:MAG: GAF domain-containing protein [Raineya sp.]|jgi:PAS domain S-box-containing protein|nr:GAF domain-containing protein [Raineya sp.]